MGSTILAGTIVGGRYRIVRELGSGSQATVYQGELIDLGKPVAIKLLARDAIASVDALARFRRETRAVAATASDHTVQIFDVGEDADVGLYMVMELLDGENLGQRLERDVRLGVDEMVAIGLQTAWALEKVHAAGVVHRDLKPDNLFLVRREAPAVCVKLLDFGVAKLNRGISPGITPCGITLGTPQYMSPEQVLATRDIDARTDLWSLGAVLFEAVAGRPAFPDGNDLGAMLGRICTEGAPRLRSIAPHVPADVADVIDEALTRDRARRIPDAGTFAQRLLEAAPESVAAVFLPQSKRMRAAARVSEMPRTVDFSEMDFDDTQTGSESAARTAAQRTSAPWAVATAKSPVLPPLPPSRPSLAKAAANVSAIPRPAPSRPSSTLASGMPVGSPRTARA